MDPATAMTAVSMGMSVVGGVMGAEGAMAGGRASRDSAMFQAAVAHRNAQIAEQNAQYATIEGEQSAMRYGMGARQRAGEIIAGQAASGLDVTSGSAKDVQQSQQTVSRMDMDQIRRNAAKTAYDYRTQEQSFNIEAMGDIAAGNQAMKAARYNADASIIGGASSVADKWLRGQNVGMYGSDTVGLGG